MRRTVLFFILYYPMEKDLFDRGQRDIESALAGEVSTADDEPSPRRSIHSRSRCERAQIAACGDEHTKDGCSGWWVLAIVTLYGAFCAAVLLNCGHDKNCSQWVAWLLIFVGTTMTAAIAMKCFNYSSRDGEIGCARWCADFSCDTWAQRNGRLPPFNSGVTVMHQQMGVTTGDSHRQVTEPQEPPMPTMPTVKELAVTRFTLDEQ